MTRAMYSKSAPLSENKINVAFAEKLLKIWLTLFNIAEKCPCLKTSRF